jgi:hypothetical protein
VMCQSFFGCGTVFVVFSPLNSLIAELDMVCNVELASIMGYCCCSELCSSAAQSASRNDFSLQIRDHHIKLCSTVT